MEAIAEHITQGRDDTQSCASYQILSPEQKFLLRAGDLLELYKSESLAECAELRKQLKERDGVIEGLKQTIQERDDEIAYLKKIVANLTNIHPAKLKKPAKRFIDLITHPQPKMVLSRMHELIDGRGGQYVAAVLMRGYWKDKILSKLPSKSEFTSEFELNGSWRGISYYLTMNSTQTHQSISDMYEAISILPATAPPPISYA